MATGNMSWQYQSQKHLPSYGVPGGSDGSGDMQDMHLKISKKIAQLTKVIYALNTKNDDHEAAMSALKDAHEEEMQQLMAETSAKIHLYRLKIGNELDLRKKVRNLEECVHVFEQEKKQAMVEIDAHNQILAEREVAHERERDEKVHQLTREVLETKVAFEQRISDFENLVRDMEREKHKNMDSVTSDYKRQVDELRKKLIDQQKLAAEERDNAAELHDLQLQKLEAEVDRLQHELKKVVEESDAKIDKAKAFYEHELSALRGSSVSSDEMALKWKEREALLKQEASKVEFSLKNKIQDLKRELEIQREEVAHLNQQLTRSRSEATGTLDHVKEMREQLSRLQKDYNDSLKRANTFEEELKVENTKTESQANDILRKSNIIGTLEAIKLTQQESIRGLEEQMRELKKRMQEVEGEKSALLNSQSDESNKLLQQLKIMSKKVDTLNGEKSALHKQFKLDLEELKISHEDESESLKQQFEKEIDSIVKSHQTEVESMKTEAEEEMDKRQRAMEERLLTETKQLEKEKTEAVLQVESEKEALDLNLQHCQTEISRLNKLIHEHESGLGDASSHISGLKSRIGELENDVTSAETRHRSTEAVVAQLRTELKEVSDAHERKVGRLNRDHAEAVDKTKRKSDEKWEKEMSKQLSELEQRLNSEHIQDRLSALQDLELRKNREMEASKSGWEDQIKQLSNQLSELRLSFDAERRDFDRKLEASKSDVTDVERKLRHDAEEAANDYNMKINHLIESHKMSLAALEQRKEEEIKSVESRLYSQHREEMHSQMRSQQIAIEGVKNQLNRTKREEMEKKEQEFIQEMDEVRGELTHQNAMALDEVRRQYEGQLAAAKMELEEIVGSKERNEEKLSQKMGDLETDLKLSTAELHKLRDRVTEQNESLSAMNREVEQKGLEILRVRSEANMELRHREEELTRRFESSQDKREAEFIRQKQGMVYEFNKATEALKDKMSSLSIALYQAEEKYQNRESRPEDLNAIKQLKAAIREREEQMQKLIDDKKFYQMELVNRETNFNKVFTAAPNVGVLDPRSKKKKGGSHSSAPARFTSQFVSVPNLNSLEPAMNGSNRLEPLRTGSGSPINYNKPLQPTPPPIPKKFLRLKADKSSGYSSDCTSYSYVETLSDRKSEKFVKFNPRPEVETKVTSEPLRTLVEEQYDNVPSDVDDVDFFSHDVTLTLNHLNGDWTSEGDLPDAIAKSSPRIDLCTNEPIAMSHCTSLPEHYLRPGLKKKSSFMSMVRSKRR